MCGKKQVHHFEVMSRPGANFFCAFIANLTFLFVCISWEVVIKDSQNNKNKES